MRFPFGAAGRFLALVVLAGASFDGSAVEAPETKPLADLLAEARPTIEAANADWVPAMKRKDARAIAAAYAPDGVFVAPRGDVIEGREAIEKFYAKGMDAGFRFLRGGLVQDGVVLAPGPLIYEWGHADVEVERDGKVRHSAGNYLTVWKRSDSGVWQIIRNLAL